MSKISWSTRQNKRPYDHQNFIQPIDVNKGETSKFYCKMYRKQMVITGKINVYDEKTFLKLRSEESNLISLFTGFCSLLVSFLC